MTSHFDPALETADRSDDWARARPFAAWLDAADDLVELWERAAERASVPDDLVERVERAPGDWRLLVITEDWCLDATATVPAVAELARRASNAELRVLDRDENLPLMDEHLTNGVSRSIPVVLVLDGEGMERAWWGPRPADLQAWFAGEAQELDKEERYRELRKWYARDRGQTTAREIAALIEQASGAGAIG